MLQVLQKAPEFKGKAVVGSGDFKTISLSDFKGKYVVLFFYPQDFTFVCPTEIQEFSKRTADFEKENAQVIGGSCDSEYSHKAWIQDGLGELRFPLLADFSKAIARDYGALLEDKGYPTRATFIIDPDGVLQYASYNNTDVGRSVGEVLRVLQGIKTGERCPAEWKPGQKTLGK
jgi:alkyl hydroperoxide reductase subunit AhpC